MMPAFEFLRPRSLEEAMGMLKAAQGAYPIAGGTNLLVDMRAGKLGPKTVVDIGSLDELRGVQVTGDDVVIGAATPIAQLLADETIRRYAGVLHSACRTFANTLIRERATIGGNLVNNAPCADTVPALLVLNAEVELACTQGRRRVPLETFLLGPFQTQRKPNELLTTIRFAIPPASAVGRFRKMGLRKISCMAKVDVAMMLDFSADGACKEARIALGAASPVARRAHDAEAALVGKTLTGESILAAADLAARAASPRAGSEYKQHVVTGLVRRLLAETAEQAGGKNA